MWCWVNNLYFYCFLKVIQISIYNFIKMIINKDQQNEIKLSDVDMYEKIKVQIVNEKIVIEKLVI